MGEFAGILIIYAFVMLFSLAVGVFFLILQGIGMSAMFKKLGFGSNWMCYLPIFNLSAMGKIAGKYENQDGKSNKKLGKWMVALTILMIVALVAFIVLVLITVFTLIADASDAIELGTDLAITGIGIFIPTIIFYFIIMALTIANTVIYYIALWKIFSIFDSGNAVAYLVLSIFFSSLAPIFIFVIRNKEPKLTYNQRLGIEMPVFEIENTQL